MDFRFSAEAERFRAEVRQFLASEWLPYRGDAIAEAQTPETIARDKAFRHKLGERGWLALSWPHEYGGQARSPEEAYVFHWEMTYAGAPVAAVGAGMVAPTLMRYASEEQKRAWLPRIASGEIDFALGYSEPNAGTDLASLRTRAVRDGDDYVINGLKIYTTGAHTSEYCWLAARTDPEAPKHKGISLFMVDLASPGVTIEPLWRFDDNRTNRTRWEDVRVPASQRVGEENRGWYYVATALDHERVMAFPVARLVRAFDELVAYVQTAEFDGRPLRKESHVRRTIAQLAVEVNQCALLSYRAVWILSRDQVPNAEASMLKVYLTELMQRLADAGTTILGLYGPLQGDGKWVQLAGQLDRLHRAAIMPTFGAGANEVQRNIIAQRGLGLPR